MSGAVVLPQPDVVVKKDAPRAWKTPIVMAVFTLVALLWFVLGTGDAEVGFRWSAARSAIQLPDTVVSAKALAIIATVLLAAITVVVALLVQRRARVSIWSVAMAALTFAASSPMRMAPQLRRRARSGSGTTTVTPSSGAPGSKR